MPVDDQNVCAEILALNKSVVLLDEKLDKLITSFSIHIEEESKMAPKIDELLTAWEQGVGVAKFVKLLAAVIVPFVAFYAWLHDHIKLI